MVELPLCSELTVSPVALLVDGENIGSRWAETLLAQARLQGAPTVRRVYGKLEHIADWADHGFRLQATRPGKNAADLLLTVEAMNLALRESFHTILVVSSDRDFSYLAEHLRELGHRIIGIGESKAPQTFRSSCSEFIELLEASPMDAVRAISPALRIPATKVIPLVRGILPRSSLKEGWAYADWIEKTLMAADPTFSPASYGHPSLVELIKTVNFFDVDTAPNGKFRLRERSHKAIAD